MVLAQCWRWAQCWGSQPHLQHSHRGHRTPLAQLWWWHCLSQEALSPREPYATPIQALEARRNAGHTLTHKQLIKKPKTQSTSTIKLLSILWERMQYTGRGDESQLLFSLLLPPHPTCTQQGTLGQDQEEAGEFQLHLQPYAPA